MPKRVLIIDDEENISARNAPNPTGGGVRSWRGGRR